MGTHVHRSSGSRQRVFLTFAASDVTLVRRVALRLQSGGDLVFDDGVPGSSFAGPRAEIVRASLVSRLRRASGVLCLFRDQTLEDDWVLWAVMAARELRLPLLGAPLDGMTTDICGRALADLGFDLVPARGDMIEARLRDRASHREQADRGPLAISDALRSMRHPLR